MEELIAMMLLGALGSGFDPKAEVHKVNILKPDIEKFAKVAQERQAEFQKKAKELARQKAETEANNAKMIFDTYLKAGFTQEQALELLKVNLADNTNAEKKGTGENNG